MSTKHTPLIRLQAAKRAYELAHQECPHWDYEGGSAVAHECCFRLDDTQRELRLARKQAEVKS